ncbi:MAG: Glutamate-pyruvate aminotransferase AlaC [Candidatus Ordinivivax streblomastigis]|uniref:Glutamate-pyruvate aminotransferase AlaC n=1 Tax=Candidatus Ordinivivax streblomastigis TaxID=2540710 RepID=A0A5M8NZ87_9BACT|nr:MAG: Glutamate-pyruvate aminotransferase AlaC [Candidatus Ordinivivax streblomastigis]
MKFPVSETIVQEAVRALHIQDFSKATIREVVAIAGRIEQQTGAEFVHMEMGIPGLPPPEIGVKAEIQALEQGVASIYPVIDGMPALKEEASRFIKAFIDLDIAPEACVPVTGSMQGTFISFVTACQCDEKKDTILFIDPGFPVQKQQAVILGRKYESFDVYDFRGEKLKEKLESYLSKGNIACIIYSNPNNPAWFCLKDNELQIIGELSEKYDTIVLEDLAYFAMDFRKALGTPFQAPFQASVGNYTNNYLLLISGSKAFSYAGQRIGIVAMSNKLYHRTYPGLAQRYGASTFGSVFIHRVLYAISAGTSHSAQYALAAMFKVASDGTFPFLEEVKEYGRRAQRLKAIFQKNGFKVVYDNDLGEEIADGFYFTIGYPGLTGDELMTKLIPYGVSAISLSTTGSRQEGLRACTSFIKDHQYAQLDERLAQFVKDLRSKRLPSSSV